MEPEVNAGRDAFNPRVEGWISQAKVIGIRFVYHCRTVVEEVRGGLRHQVEAERVQLFVERRP